MLSPGDERWATFKGGYRVPYDPRPALERLRAGDNYAFAELWNELHHQNDVDLASYASVPHLVQIHRERDKPEWQTYALISTIELCRGRGRNPPLPEWMRSSYDAAWEQVIGLACRDLPRVSDETSLQAILAAIALAKGSRLYGEVLLNLSGEALSGLMKEFRNG